MAHDDTLEFFNTALQAFGAKVLTARTVDDGQLGLAALHAQGDERGDEEREACV